MTRGRPLAFVVGVVLTLSTLVDASAESQQGGLPNLQDQVAALQAAVGGLQSALNAERAARIAADQSLQNALAAEAAARAAADQSHEGAVTELQTALNAETAARVALQGMVTALQGQLSAAQATITCLQMEGNADLIVEGCNLHIRSGAGATDAPVNGLGT